MLKLYQIKDNSLRFLFKNIYSLNILGRLSIFFLNSLAFFKFEIGIRISLTAVTFYKGYSDIKMDKQGYM